MTVVASVSPWFSDGARPVVGKVLTAEAAMMAEYLMDAEVGSTAAVTARKFTHTPIRISKEAHIGYLADMDQQWRHDRIQKLRNPANNGGQ